MSLSAVDPDAYISYSLIGRDTCTSRLIEVAPAGLPVKDACHTLISSIETQRLQLVYVLYVHSCLYSLS